MEALFDIRPAPALPGAGPSGPMVTACVFDVELEGPGIHTRSHFSAELLTHPFFSREALHAALFDIWEPRVRDVYEPDPIPYSSTPLVALHPTYVTLHYGSPEGWQKADPTYPGLTVGTMQALAPGTLLRAAIWGDPATFPEIFVGRGFRIGKGRTTARVIHVAKKDVHVDTVSQTDVRLPVQVSREEMFHPRMRRIAYRRRADAGRYILLDIRLDSNVPRFVIDGVTVPALDYFDLLVG